MRSYLQPLHGYHSPSLIRYPQPTGGFAEEERRRDKRSGRCRPVLGRHSRTQVTGDADHRAVPIQTSHDSVPAVAKDVAPVSICNDARRGAQQSRIADGPVWRRPAGPPDTNNRGHGAIRPGVPNRVTRAVGDYVAAVRFIDSDAIRLCYLLRRCGCPLDTEGTRNGDDALPANHCRKYGEQRDQQQCSCRLRGRSKHLSTRRERGFITTTESGRRVVRERTIHRTCAVTRW